MGMPTTKTRKSVTLEPDDTERLARFDVDDTLHVAARRLIGGNEGQSFTEAGLLHALVVIGLDAIEREADEERYAQLARCADEEDVQYEMALRGRRRSA